MATRAAAMLAWLKWMYFSSMVTMIPCTRHRSLAIWRGAVWGCTWFLKLVGWWTEGGGGVHCNHFCYWGKLHYHDLQCDSIYIAHNDLLFWEVDGSVQLYACWISRFKPSGSSSGLGLSGGIICYFKIMPSVNNCIKIIVSKLISLINTFACITDTWKCKNGVLRPLSRRIFKKKVENILNHNEKNVFFFLKC